ncbi:MAG: YraN family protein [Pseudomonadota bacterium]
MSAPQARLGEAGEREAESFLRRHGLTLLEKNYRCRGGEIDLVMRVEEDGLEVLVFVEVRLRGAGAQVNALESVDRNKQRKLITAARHFLMENPSWNEHPCRFDVVALDSHRNRLMWVPAAFET